MRRSRRRCRDRSPFRPVLVSVRRLGEIKGSRTGRRLAVATGLPQLRPKLASAGMLASSAGEYPKACAMVELSAEAPDWATEL